MLETTVPTSWRNPSVQTIRRILVASSMLEYLFWSSITGPDPRTTYHFSQFWSSNHFHPTICSCYRTAPSSNARIIEFSYQRFNHRLFKRHVTLPLMRSNPRNVKFLERRCTYSPSEYTYGHIFWPTTRSSHNIRTFSVMNINYVVWRSQPNPRIYFSHMNSVYWFESQTQ